MRRALQVLVVLSVLAVVVILAGCSGGTGAPDGATVDTAKKPPPTPPPPPRPGKLVCWKFTDWGDRTTDLLTMKADGSDVQLLGVEGGGSYPSWSPDGTRICFTSRGSAGPESLPRIYTVAADGSDQQQLTIGAEGDVPDGSDFYAAWSPDGAEIAFARATGSHDTPGGGPEYIICVKEWPDGTLRQLTSGYWDNNPTWSPDGEYIAFTRTPDYGLMVMPADGTGPPQPVDEEPLWAIDPAWGELGIAWGNGGIFHVPIALENGQWQVDGDVAQLTYDVHHRSATWSPDGSAIAFHYETWKNRGPTYHTCIVDVATGAVQEIGQGAHADWWAPASPQ